MTNPMRRMSTVGGGGGTVMKNPLSENDVGGGVVNPTKMRTTISCVAPRAEGSHPAASKTNDNNSPGKSQ